VRDDLPRGRIEPRIDPDDAPVRRRHRRTGGGVLALVMPRRKTDTVALAIATAAAVAVLVNALLFQQKSPPAKPLKPQPTASLPIAPTKRTVPAAPAPAATPTPVSPSPASTPVPPPRSPAPLNRPRAEIVLDIQRALAERGYYDGAVDGVLGPRTDQAMKQFLETQGLKLAAAPSETLLAGIRSAPARSEITAAISKVPEPRAPRVLAVQRVLAKYGYGPLKLSAQHDADTRAAIERFERDRKLPPTGEMNERLVRQLAAFTGAPVE
jgi:peptidoglycan hydrolase-like protein with peptidoglycan-binding domain